MSDPKHAHPPAPAPAAKPEKTAPAEGSVVEQAKKVYDNIADSLKGLGLPDLNTAASLLNPFISDSAESAAAQLKSKLGKDHWLCSKKGEAFIGVVAALIEKHAHSQKDPLKGALMKGADWLEAFAESLRTGGTSKSEHAVKTDKVPTTVVLATQFEELHETVLRDSHELLKAAKTDKQKVAAREKIQRDVEAFAKVQKILTEGLPPPPLPEKEIVEPAPETPRGPGFNELLASKIKSWKETETLREVETPSPKQGWLGWLLLLPWRLIGLGTAKKTTGRAVKIGGKIV